MAVDPPPVTNAKPSENAKSRGNAALRWKRWPMERKEWSLRARVTALCLVAVAVIGLLTTAVVITASSGRSGIDRLLNDIGPMHTSYGTLLQSLLDQETGVRGYALSGQESDLSPYTTGLEVEQSATAEIVASRAATPLVLDQLQSVTLLSEAWRRDIAEPAINAVRTQSAQA